MAKVSTKENKNMYQTTREGLKLTRETASELLETIAPERGEGSVSDYTGDYRFSERYAEKEGAAD